MKQPITTRKNTMIIVYIGILIIITILFDHARIHGGIPFQEKDFAESGYALVKSHEGWILLTILIVVAVISDRIRRKHK